MSLGNALLNCREAQYRVILTGGCDNTPLRQIPDVVSIRLNRRLDTLSSANVVFATSDSGVCEDIANFLCLGRHYLTIVRNGCVEWKGPTVRAEFRDDQISIFGFDPLWWLTKRVEQIVNVEYSEQTDLFKSIISTANTAQSVDCGLDIEPLCFANIYGVDGGPAGSTSPTNVGQLRTLAAALKVLGDTFLDYTVVGDDLIYGYQQIAIPASRSGPVPVLSDNDWKSSPRIVQDITKLSNDIYIKPNEQPVFNKSVCTIKHGLHQQILSNGQETDVGLLEAAADSQLVANSSLLTSIENLNGSELLGDVRWDLPRMVPGMLVDVNTSLYGLAVQDTFRLNNVTVNFSSRGESVKIGLEPSGIAS